ncbi:MAG: TrbC family F-type conjugative pilus assembly protein [Pseudomonadota bacterium]|nr:TrbC family F-type conjugative pilus assembly protein [Pseudomonadota bacterium]
MRSSRRLLAAVLALTSILSGGVSGADPGAIATSNLSGVDMRWIRETIEAIRGRAERVPPTGLEHNPRMDSARAQALAVIESVPTPFSDLDIEEHSGNEVYVFVSESLGDATLRDILARASGRDEVTIVLRGIRDGETIRRGLLWVRRLAEGLDPVPDVALDPMRYREYGVTAVPEMVLVSDGQLAARVRGLANPDWLIERVAQGQTGDLGAYGATLAIAEPDLLAVMQERIRRIDWAEKKRKAAERYWDHARFELLPAARQTRTRRVDPTLVVTRDIATPDGKVIARAGERIDPLGMKRFSLRLVIFDATNPAQVERVARLARQEGAWTRTVYMTTRLDRDDAWKRLGEIEDTLDAPLYLLTPDVRTRFELERVPSVVTADESAFVVRELPVTERPAREGQGKGNG